MTPTKPNLTTIHLVGSLGRAIGHEELTLDVMSPAEAIRAIDVITKGKLRTYLSGPGAKRYYKVAVQKRDAVLNVEEIGNRSGRAEIWIMPTIRGRDSAGKKILAGIALIGIAAFAAPALGAWFTAGWGAAGTAAAGLSVQTLFYTYGIALVLGGIAQALTPRSQGPTQGATEDTASSIFQGNAASVAQGIAVPIIYGRILCPAIPVSLSVDNNDVSLTSAGNLGTVTKTNLEGGGEQYESVDDTDEPVF